MLITWIIKSFDAVLNRCEERLGIVGAAKAMKKLSKIKAGAMAEQGIMPFMFQSMGQGLLEIGQGLFRPAGSFKGCSQPRPSAPDAGIGGVQHLLAAGHKLAEESLSLLQCTSVP